MIDERKRRYHCLSVSQSTSGGSERWSSPPPIDRLSTAYRPPISDHFTQTIEREKREREKQRRENRHLLPESRVPLSQISMCWPPFAPSRYINQNFTQMQPPQSYSRGPAYRLINIPRVCVQDRFRRTKYASLRRMPMYMA